MCMHALMSPWTKVSLDIKCPLTILDKSLLGQMSLWTIVSLDKSLLGQKSPWTKVPSDKRLLGQSPLGQLSQHHSKGLF